MGSRFVCCDNVCWVRGSQTVSHSGLLDVYEATDKMSVSLYKQRLLPWPATVKNSARTGFRKTPEFSCLTINSRVRPRNQLWLLVLFWWSKQSRPQNVSFLQQPQKTFHCFEYLANGMIKGPFHRRCKNIPIASQELEVANQMRFQAVRTADCQRKRKNLITSISCFKFLRQFANHDRLSADLGKKTHRSH